LREQFEDPLQIELGEFTVIAPFEGGAVELIGDQLGLGEGLVFGRGDGIEHGRHGRMYGPLDKTFARP
jgi:hypothetical protein